LSPKTILRDAQWFDAERARGYLNILALFTLIAVLGWGVASALNGGLDPTGKPLGADFPSFWAASKLALQGHAPLAWSPAPHYALQKAMFPAHPVGYSAFFYPPPYLLICLPLALLPYTASLVAWLTLSAAAMARAVKPLVQDGRTWIALAAFPAVLSNLGHGQNAFLTTGLFAYGLLRAKDKPWTAGLVLGLLVIKPHLALVLPFALAAGGRWKTFVATGTSAVGLCIASYLVFGPEVWTGFFSTNAVAKAALEQNLVGNEKMQSVFAAVRLLGGRVALGWGAQALTSLGALTVLVWATLKSKDTEARAAVAASAALLASPFLLDYDLMLAALPLLWLLREGRTRGFLPYEKSAMLAAFILPLVSRLAAGALHLPFAPLVLTALLALTVRRAISCDSRH
jgi:hypothetical protein